MEPQFTENTLKILRSILGENYAETEIYKKAVGQLSERVYTVKAGTPKRLEAEAHGPCC